MITKEIIEHMIQGTWYIKPEDTWATHHISESVYNCLGKDTLFIAMDEPTWLKGTGNTGIYGQWNDTHQVIHQFADKIGGVVAQRPIENLPPHIPQYIVSNSFDFINHYSQYIQDKISSKKIMITGTVGKTSTKDYLHTLLNEFGSTCATNKNHNSRTGVKLTLSNAMSNPDYLIIEAAMSALWMKTGSISRLVCPDITIITEIGVGQNGCDEDRTADFKSRIADGLNQKGVVIINRDIKNYTQLVNYVKRYHDHMISYGQHPQADIHFQKNQNGISIRIKQQQYQIDLNPLPDDGTLSNMVAAIATLTYLELDILKVQHLFHTLCNKSSTLQIDYIAQKKLYVIDDTYNAEYLSMVNAFKFCHTRFNEKRKILIIGDIINLGEQSKQVHEALLTPILENDFELIATFGQEMIYLNHLLPKHQNLGHYRNENDCVEQVQRSLKPEDVILVKGSRRNSTIHLIPQLLRKQLPHCTTIERPHYVIAPLNTTDFEQEIWSTQTEYGLAPLMLIYLAIQKYALGEIQLKTMYQVSLNVSKEAQRENALGLYYGEQYSFLQLMQYTILTQKADCILALAELLYHTTSQALVAIKTEAEKLAIDPKIFLNVSGRNYKNQTQTKTFKDVFFIARKIFTLPAYFRQSFFVNSIDFKEHTLNVISPIAYDPLFHGFLFIGDQHRRTYLTYRDQKQPEISICSMRHSEQRIEHLLPYYQNFKDLPESKKLIAKTPFINILGDTYFGEAYTKIRKKRGVKDALQQYGYAWSFEKIAKFFNEDDLNLVNFEAVFYDQKQLSPLDRIKPFILGADAEQTLKEFQNRHINCLVLANNHLKDYGSEYLISTLEHFKRAGIQYIGAGHHQKEAHQFFEIHRQTKTYAIFNGYWHRSAAYNKFDFYALGHRAGVACSQGLMLEQISQYKIKHPHNKVIVINHWGVDFKPIHPEQEKLADLLTAMGVDLIIGHGSHSIQPIRSLNNKPVIFSIGNGVFNSNGEYSKHQAAPYGYIVRLNLDKDEIRLYPIFTNNLETFWQPHTVSDIQFEDIKFKIQKDRSQMINHFGQDELGHFLSLSF